MFPTIWKRVFLVLAIAAPALAARGLAEPTGRLPDGLYPAADSSQCAAVQKAQREKVDYVDSFDPKFQEYQRDSKDVEELTKARDTAARLRRQAETGGMSWSPWVLGLSEQVWLAVLAGLGFVLALAAAGYVWWSRRQMEQDGGAILLPITQDALAKADSGGRQEKPPKRRAA